MTHALCRRRITGGVNGGLLNGSTLKSLDFRRDFLFPLSHILHNTRPIGCQVGVLISHCYPHIYWTSIILLIKLTFVDQDTLQLFISIMLLADISVTLLALTQYYWMSLGAFLAVLLISPLSLLSPFPAGFNALFSKGFRRASLARVYALWNVTSLSNIVSIILPLLSFA